MRAGAYRRGQVRIERALTLRPAPSQNVTALGIGYSPTSREAVVQLSIDTAHHLLPSAVDDTAQRGKAQGVATSARDPAT